MIYGYEYETTSSIFAGGGAEVWLIISAVLAVVGGIGAYFIFLSPENDNKFKGFVGWLYDFLSFKKLTLEIILKILYLITAAFITLSSFAVIGTSFLGFLAYLIVGNLVSRIIYEFSLVILLIHRNTVEINKSLKSKNSKEK